MVITHLILNDMLKLKGEIVDICMLLEDDELDQIAGGKEAEIE